ncbi:unnamed protein product, partial [Gordionus sp. m RMFG-2023]
MEIGEQIFIINNRPKRSCDTYLLLRRVYMILSMVLYNMSYLIKICYILDKYLCIKNFRTVESIRKGWVYRILPWFGFIFFTLTTVPVYKLNEIQYNSHKKDMPCKIVVGKMNKPLAIYYLLIKQLYIITFIIIYLYLVLSFFKSLWKLQNGRYHSYLNNLKQSRRSIKLSSKEWEKFTIRKKDQPKIIDFKKIKVFNPSWKNKSALVAISKPSNLRSTNNKRFRPRYKLMR